MMPKQLKQLNNDQRGLTLTELIVTFALMGILLSAVAMILTASMSLHTELTSVMYSANVSELLLDKITGELTMAQATGNATISLKEPEKGEEKVETQEISFFNQENVQCSFLVKDGKLRMEGKEWALDDSAYMGYRITGLTFTRLNEENVLEVSIRLKNLKSGFEFMDSKAVKCMEFHTKDDFKKIQINA